MKYIIVNTKNKFNETSVRKYYEILNKINMEKIKFIICPEDSHLRIFSDRKYCLGAQGLRDINLLKNNGVTHAIVGHYNDRVNGISIDKIKKDIVLLQTNDIKPIYCIGEENRDDSFDNIFNELNEVFDYIPNEDLIIVAYEPYWAIGSNTELDSEYIKNNIMLIKNYIYKNYKVNINVVYGGSVNVDNINILDEVDEIDGFMISTGALKEKELLKLVEQIGR